MSSCNMMICPMGAGQPIQSGRSSSTSSSSLLRHMIPCSPVIREYPARDNVPGRMRRLRETDTHDDHDDSAARCHQREMKTVLQQLEHECGFTVKRIGRKQQGFAITRDDTGMDKQMRLDVRMIVANTISNTTPSRTNAGKLSSQTSPSSTSTG